MIREAKCSPLFSFSLQDGDGRVEHEAVCGSEFLVNALGKDHQHLAVLRSTEPFHCTTS